MSESLDFFDIAHEGAQLRAVATAVADGLLAHLSAARSVVALAPTELSDACAHATSRLAAPLPVPLVITDTVPRYLGALDVLVLVGPLRAESQLRDVLAAQQRGVAVVAVDADEDGLLPEVPVPAALPGVSGESPARIIGLLSCVIAVAAGEGSAAVCADLTQAAELLDAELAMLGPAADPATNPAVAIRAQAPDFRAHHAGDPAAAEVIAAVWRAQATRRRDLPTLVWAAPDVGTFALARTLILIARGLAATTLSDPISEA